MWSTHSRRFQGNASVICCAIHSAVGCAVTLIQTSSRRSVPRPTFLSPAVAQTGGAFFWDLFPPPPLLAPCPFGLAPPPPAPRACCCPQARAPPHPAPTRPPRAL